MRLEDAEVILRQHGQEHLLAYYDELSGQEQADLLSQIEKLDFSLLDSLKPENTASAKRGKVEPLTEAVTAVDIAKNIGEYTEIGIEALRNGKVAAVLLAGGQGTRLGFDKPKGMFNIGVNRELYIFECLINNLMEVVKTVGKWIPLLIMTSEKNNDETVNFLREKNFFGYNSEYISFFVQDMAPSVDFNGRIYLEEKSKISLSPNGNGGWFSSIVRAGLLDKLKSGGVEWLNVFSVDNVLQKIADPAFIGAVIKSGSQSGSKVVAKANPEERVGAMCLENGMPSIIEYYELTEEMANQRLSDGELAYRFGVTLNYLFRMDKLEEINNNKLSVHIVRKKIPYIDENGCKIAPEEPNGYKFELLILDMIHMYDSCLPYEVVRRKEFAPVKNASGVDSIDTARELLTENGVAI
ncbi:MAG: UDPGP type 1 family protein [Ruminococcus flavefaciens]|nr:UDPGP type 1 family protein [Ruminococcus flavefaciens]MCM1229964.1 UDPGP type 1 family protein [Ruminococcus flavefaciens]